MLPRSICRSCHSQLSPRGLVLVQKRSQSGTTDFSRLQTSLPARKLPILYDDVTPRNTHNLNVSLSSFLPVDWLPSSVLQDGLPEPSHEAPLPPSHHLVYFNPVLPASKLLPDGTDPNQSPGVPFVRRMWAGGYVKFSTEDYIRVDGRRYGCVEGIRDVSIKGKPGQEKVFVGIERRFGELRERESEDQFRGRLWGEKEDDINDALLIERRNIVFMRERSAEELAILKAAGAAPAPGKMLKPQHPPTFTHTLTPTGTLLFRYSALTFNAHAIHLDPQYCRTIEGHRDLLFHGPLSFTLLTLMLQNHIKKSPNSFIKSIEYRNLAPLYANEPLKLCGREVDGEGRKFEIWAETPEGGIAVKGTARVGVSSF